MDIKVEFLAWNKVNGNTLGPLRIAALEDSLGASPNDSLRLMFGSSGGAVAAARQSQRIVNRR